MWQGKLVDMFTGIPTKEQLSTFLHKMLDLAPAATPAQEEVGICERSICDVHVSSSPIAMVCHMLNLWG